MRSRSWPGGAVASSHSGDQPAGGPVTDLERASMYQAFFCTAAQASAAVPAWQGCRRPYSRRAPSTRTQTSPITLGPHAVARCAKSWWRLRRRASALCTPTPFNVPQHRARAANCDRRGNGRRFWRWCGPTVLRAWTRHLKQARTNPPAGWRSL